MTSRRLYLIALVLVFALGIVLRTIPFSSFKEGIGFDEMLYGVYTTQLLERGIVHYPSIVEDYIVSQTKRKGAILPPTRILYIGTSALWSWAVGVKPLAALRQVSSLFSILTLALTFGFMRRLAGNGAALAVTALMAFAPTQIHMGQHALLDGFFTFWALLALWLLWENLQRPSRPWLLIGYGLSLALLVSTKENAAFVFIGIVALLVANRWIGFGTVNRPLVLATLLGPALGALVLTALSGGLESLFAAYILFSTKNHTLDFAIKTQDGPWYRYLVDLMLVSPLVLILSLGALFQLDRERHRPQLFAALFIAASYLVMCNLRYGINLRFANMWDAPLRLLAFTQLGLLATRFGGKRREFWLVLGVIALCAYDLRQYWILAIQFDRFYEMVSEILLRALHILK